MPCRRMNTVIGNIRKQDFVDIWHLPYFEPFRTRELMKNQCSDCSQLQRCSGCRAVAKASTGSATGDDPHCFLYKKKK